jgi:hypothetical protein
VADDDEDEHEDADHDRRHAVQDVEGEREHVRKPLRRELVQVDRRQDPNG